ncbi:CHAT domain-containing protein [Microcoleus sp. AR_TQ3_B6]|uniref:nSTAND1 domain-containing NTPase n=1 Tax=Microcoleus sp. AR_TQ3_B6 TaxID=3055284 RepID=UPI002FD2BFD2
MNAFEFEITIQSKSGDSSWPIVVRCKQPDGLTIHSKEILQLSQEDLNKLTQKQENEREYGTLLGKALFRGAVYDTFVRVLSKSSQDSLLRILLSIEAADNDSLKTLHWERLCAPIDADGEWHLLARNQRVPFSLYIPTIIDRRFPPIGRRDLRALVLVASPSNIGKFQLAPFDVEAVLSGVKEALGEIPYEILANNVAGAIGPPTLQELSKQLTNAKKPYTLLHFVAHGKLLDNGETVLYWAKADNEVLPVTGEDLLSELKNIGNHQRSLPHFTFLCTCESADPRAEAGLGGLGQRLVRNLGMPAVIAMTRKVSVETGLALGQSFYRRLRESGEVDTALQEATAGLSKRHDIAVPALFSRLGGRPLFSDRLDNRDLTDEEIEYGIEKLRQLLQERAPHASVLKQRFETQVKTLKNTRGADSRTAREDRYQAIAELNNLCEQVIEISFDALAALGKQPPQYKAECPFPGLSSFAEKKYHKFFFGRDELIRDLQNELAKDNFLAVIGTSGSGKSSVVLAGLIPKLKEEQLSLQWAYMTPGKEPARQLKRRLERLLKVSEQHSILVVDQFEEVFTLCEDKADRVEFIEKLLNFASRRKVVITMRADFLGECTFYPELRKRIETRQKLVGPMEPAELITAMKMQADRGGLRFEAGLSHAILNDVQGEPGAMPLLQYALQELWKRRRGRWLCNEEYQAIGGVQKAIAKTADDFYNSLSAPEQEQLQNIFLRLTRLDASAIHGEKRRDTRRRVELEDLVPTGDDLAVTRKLVQQLAGEGVRLVVTSRNEATGKEEVEVAHEALIRYWPTLQNWLNQNRSDLLLRETINQAAQDWQQHREQPGQDTYLIHHGGRLEDAEVLWKHPKFVQLNQLEAEYVLACVQLRERRRQLEEQRRKRQLMAAAIAAFMLGGFAIFAGIKWREAEIHQILALLQSAETSLVTHQPIEARIGSLRAAKELKDSKWQRWWPDAELSNQVLGKSIGTFYAGQEINRLKTNQYSIESIVFTPDGRLAIADDKGTVGLWDTKTQKLEYIQKETSREKPKEKSTSGYLSVQLSPDGQKLALIDYKNGIYLSDTKKTNNLKKLPRSEGKIFSKATFSADSQLLSASSSEGVAYLWDTKTKDFKISREPNRAGEKEALFSPNGQFSVIIRDDNTFYLENTKTKKPDTLLYNPPEKTKVASVQIGPNSQILAVKLENRNTFALWDTKTRKWLPQIDPLWRYDFDSVKFSPDSQLLAFREANGTIWLRDIKGRTLHKLQGQDSLSSLAFSRDRQLLVTTDDRTMRLWAISDRGQLKVTPTDRPVDAIAFNQHNQLLRVSKKDGSVWPIDTKGKERQIKLQGNQEKKAEIDEVAFSPDGQLLTVIGKDNSIWLGNTTDRQLGKLQAKDFSSMAFSPDSQRLVTGGKDGTIRLWDKKGKPLNKQLPKHQGSVYSVQISPDNQLLAVIGDDNSIWLGNTTDKQLRPLNAKEVYTMVFSHDSQRLITGGKDGIIRLWNNQGEPLNKKLADHKSAVYSVAFSQNDERLVTGGRDGTARLWSIKDRKSQPLAAFPGHQGYVANVAIGPDGKTLAINRSDTNVRLYQIKQELDELVAMNCDWLRDYLNNPQTKGSESDPDICKNISTPSSSPKK